MNLGWIDKRLLTPAAHLLHSPGSSLEGCRLFVTSTIMFNDDETTTPVETTEETTEETTATEAAPEVANAEGEAAA